MKRMYANEELVKLIQENAPEVEVDDALSNTSENPVQNKVIYGALEDKQDALPDTTGETGKFLKVGSDGLEWAEGEGGKLYLHNINMYWTYFSTIFNIDIRLLSSSSTQYTKSSLITYLKTILPTIADSSTRGTSALCVNGFVVSTDESTGYTSILTGLHIGSSNTVSVWGYYMTNIASPSKIGERAYFNLENWNFQSDFVIEIQ